MKYYTKKWYNLMQNLYYTDDIKTIEDKDYSEEEIKQICQDEYDKQLEEYINEEEALYNEPPINNLDFLEDLDRKDIIVVNEEDDTIIEPKSNEEAKKIIEEQYYKELEEFKNRPAFNRKEVEKEFEESYQNGLRYSKENYPKFVSDEVDERFLALHLMPKSIFNELKIYEKENQKEFEKIEEEAEKELSNQNIPEDILNIFFEFHDGNIKELAQNGEDIVLTIETEEGQIKIVNFKNGVFLENEIGKYTKKDINEYCVWLYYELYKINDKYELHILIQKEEGLKYITIKCDNVSINGGTKDGR